MGGIIFAGTPRPGLLLSQFTLLSLSTPEVRGLTSSVQSASWEPVVRYRHLTSQSCFQRILALTCGHSLCRNLVRYGTQGTDPEFSTGKTQSCGRWLGFQHLFSGFLCRPLLSQDSPQPPPGMQVICLCISFSEATRPGPGLDPAPPPPAAGPSLRDASLL